MADRWWRRLVRRPQPVELPPPGNGGQAALAKAAAERRLRETLAQQRERDRRVDSLAADLQRAMRRRPA